MSDLRDQVQVSRMMLIPFNVIRVIPDGHGISDPEGATHNGLLLMRNSRRLCLSAHFIVYGANSSLPPPRHRC